MEINIRKSNLKELTSQRIPKDFAGKMKYFNEGLEKKCYPYIPRKNPITVEEIKKLWIPYAENNIDFIAETNGKIIGSATIFYDLNATAYKEASLRKPGEIGMAIAPDYSHKDIGTKIIRTIISELERTNKTAFLHTDINFGEEKSIMETLGYKGKLIENFERYTKAGLSGKVLEYKLP